MQQQQQQHAALEGLMSAGGPAPPRCVQVPRTSKSPVSRTSCQSVLRMIDRPIKTSSGSARGMRLWRSVDNTLLHAHHSSATASTSTCSSFCSSFFSSVATSSVATCSSSSSFSSTASSFFSSVLTTTVSVLVTAVVLTAATPTPLAEARAPP
ncbi:hypothetical protein EYF80_035892 [Liparis tanakae]|uniref:Uncharacterized protein n=1 Tax=Liparis tanakae TaxID=230148 RepID=A0A4Z2GKZ2_9TELE|nr:hypothetical protein EYF80_035892 [Liparis tanakae]